METKETNIEDMSYTKSSVKITKNSRGVNWEVRVVLGDEDRMESLKAAALKIHNELEKEFMEIS